MKIRKIIQKLFIVIIGLSGLTLPAYTANATESQLSKQEVANLLGWEVDPVGHPRCGGYYTEPSFSSLMTEEVPLTQGPINITFDQGEFFQQGTSVLSGKVVLTQPDRVINADKVYLLRDSKTGQWSTADLMGDVYLREPGRLIIAKKAHLRLSDKTGWLQDTLYRFSLSPSAQLLNTQEALLRRQGYLSENSLNAWGHAAEVNEPQVGIVTLRHANYTTCSPLMNVWQISSSTIHLNHDTGRGVARDVVLRVKDIPIFYTPYFNFPIDKRRQSGFLFPTFGNSTDSGLTFAEPFYWNLAPNYDATITPGWFSLRGAKLDGLFRYLTNTTTGQVKGSIIPDDKEFAHFQDRAPDLYPPSDELQTLEGNSTTRRYFSWLNNTRLNDHWSGNLDYSYVSDDYYFQDFGNTPAVVGTNQLLRHASVNYQGQNWVFLGQLQSYQTLHPINRAVTDNQYSSLPKLQLNGDFPEQPYGLNFQLNNEAVYFTRGRDSNDTTEPPSAKRFNIQPGVSWPLNRAESYFTPTIQFYLTQYNITHQAEGDPNNITRALPVFNLDTGLFFDRLIGWLGSNYQQTLEPRLYYLYVPYRNQNNIPVFDTTIQPFDYDQLFRLNRFTGLDRIGDANQVTAAVTTRFLEQSSGEEKMRASVGQIYYFARRKVTLCNTPGCSDSNTVPGVTSDTEGVSPIAGQMDYHLSRLWDSRVNLAWDPHQSQTISSNVNFQYHPGFNKVFNLGYAFVHNGDVLNDNPTETPVPASNLTNFSQPSTSFAWPIKEKWRLVGSYSYNLSDKHPQNYFYGVEYSACCWAVRLVGSKTFTSLNQDNTPVYDTAVYLQFQFKGLGNIGVSDPSSLLVNSIPGYVDNFGQI